MEVVSRLESGDFGKSSMRDHGLSVAKTPSKDNDQWRTSASLWITSTALKRWQLRFLRIAKALESLARYYKTIVAPNFRTM
jgi:hypothetical protein